uniref:Uncharacterized protein n=1 Tax=Vespula pensylvanica TaxID=30213 RepID=A0A834N7Y7_VESPE|nr:hypothetical protein H0235_015907 [Vespula pensylvanica]
MELIVSSSNSSSSSSSSSRKENEDEYDNEKDEEKDDQRNELFREGGLPYLPSSYETKLLEQDRNIDTDTK